MRSPGPRRGFASVLATLLLASTAASAADYDGMLVTYDAPMEAVQKAAIAAITSVGAEIRREEPAYVEGKRRNHVGFEAGSGGEILSVSLVPVAEGRTRVKIRTTKTMLGRFGQTLWDRPIADHIARLLAAQSSAP